MTTTKEFLDKIDKAANSIRSGTNWKHYKGGIYTVKDFSIDSETEEVLVNYRRIDGNIQRGEHNLIWSRPYKEWFQDVEASSGSFIPRFQLVRKIERWVTDKEIEQLKKAE